MSFQPAIYQPNLYEFDHELPQLGSVVRQTWPWIGHCQLVAPYLVVIRIERKQESSYLCQAIPFGHWPDQICWFRPEDIALTGLSIDLPSAAEISDSFEHAGRHTSYLARLSLCEDGTRYVSQWDWDNYEPDPKPEPLRCNLNPKGYYVAPSLIDIDAPIVAELEARGLPWRIGEVTRQNFYEVLA